MEVPHSPCMQRLLEKLRVTHTKISNFELFQLSIDHRNTLFDALNKTKVDLDIPVVKFMELVSNIETNLDYNILSFQESEFFNEDVIDKNIELYIYVNIDGVYVKKDLNYTHSNVNVYLVELL